MDIKNLTHKMILIKFFFPIKHYVLGQGYISFTHLKHMCLADIRIVNKQALFSESCVSQM